MVSMKKKEHLSVIPLVVVSLSFLFGTVWAMSVSQNFIPFSLDKSYDEFSTDTFRVEDLLFVAKGKGVTASFNIKNKAKIELDPVLTIALFDAEKNLLAAGKYSAAFGFDPRETSSEKIILSGDYGAKNVTFVSFRLGLDE